MNIDIEDRGQQLPVDSSSDIIGPPVAAEDYYLTNTLASSTRQDRAEDDASVREKGPSPASIRYDNEETKDENNERQWLRHSCNGADDEDVNEQFYSIGRSMTPSERELATRKLPDDTFSFLIYSDVKSRAFILAIIVFSLQITIYIILGLDIIEKDNRKNPFDFPVNVETSVRISEFLAILISIMTQHDVRKAICLFRDGFDEGSLTVVFPGARLWKWALSIGLRASEGILGLVITFLLIMRSSEVRELLLNFLAVEFVTTLDDTVFALAGEGFLGRTLKKEKKNLCDKSYIVRSGFKNSKEAMIASVAYFIVLFISFFTGWIVILLKQRNGAYLCNQIFSQFGDESLPILGTFTGTGLFYNRRSMYRLKDGGLLLAYCKDDTRWTLSLTKGDNPDAWNPCVWYAASSETTSFDVLSTTSSPWIVNSTNRAAPLAHPFALDNDLRRESIETSFLCAECNDETNPCPLGAKCKSNGICGDCPNEYSGSMCEIPPDGISNGQCDSRFNNITFDFDGGDCCDNKCRSTSENTCGKTGLGYIDTGYPLCKSASDQLQLSGDPIYGVNRASRSGQAVALSGKGTVLAVADPGLSIVRLFDKDGAEWKQRDTLKGISDSNFGSAISLSDESFNVASNPRTSPTVTLAVGAPKAGLVRVYTCSTVGCIQRGDDILGGLRFGNSLSISKDGESIAIGGAARESVSQTTATNGEVKVFTWSNDTWEERESVTIVRPSSRKLSDPPYQFGLQGYYVSLSGDYLAVGTLEGNVTHGPRFEAAKLITQVYKWDKSTGWDQLGREIEKDFYDDASFGAPWPLKSVVIKGSILAVGSNSSVDVYSWNEASRNWIPREVDLVNSSEANGLVVWSVDLSEDADILAVGGSLENPQPTDESVRMYQWNGTRYTALSNGVPGGPAVSISLSSDGTAVAVGLPFDSSNGGSTRVYKFYPSSPCDDSSEIPLRISFTTDGRPEETSWELQVDSKAKLSSGSLADYMYTSFVEEVCVPARSCVNFIVYDTQGDGLNPPGIFALMRNGVEVARGGDFKGETCIADVNGVGDCECTTKCKDDGSEQLLRVEITLGEEPREWDTYWDLTDQGAGNKIIFDGPYNITGETRVREICMPVSACYLFRLESTDDASALIFLNGKKISEATMGQSVKIGDSCS